MKFFSVILITLALSACANQTCSGKDGMCPLIQGGKACCDMPCCQKGNK